jgi:hypothetical protein
MRPEYRAKSACVYRVGLIVPCCMYISSKMLARVSMQRTGEQDRHVKIHR